MTASPLEAGPSNLNAHPQPSRQSAPPTSLRSASLQGPTPGPAYTVGGEPLVSRREYNALRQELEELQIVHRNLQERYQDLERVVGNALSRVDSVKRVMTSIAQVCESTRQSVTGIPPDSLRMGMAFPFERDDASPTPQGPPQSHSPSPSTYPASTLPLTWEEQEDPSSASPSIGNPRTPPTERPMPPLPLSTPPPPLPLSTPPTSPAIVYNTRGAPGCGGNGSKLEGTCIPKGPRILTTPLYIPITSCNLNLAAGRHPSPACISPTRLSTLTATRGVSWCPGGISQGILTMP